jgi:succinate dehydrogenase hydrophobic anchor subunit
MNSGFTMRWLVQAGLGVMLVILLAIHLIVNHWAAPHGLLTYADIVRYYDIPGIAWMEAIFLVTVTAHCLLGLHSILLDLTLSARGTRIATQLVTFIGLAAILYGVWLTRTIVSR